MGGLKRDTRSLDYSSKGDLSLCCPACPRDPCGKLSKLWFLFGSPKLGPVLGPVL